jgi:hypothetical protein
MLDKYKIIPFKNEFYKKHLWGIMTSLFIAAVLVALLISPAKQALNDSIHRKCLNRIRSISSAIHEENVNIESFLNDAKQLLTQYEQGNVSQTFWEMNFWSRLNFDNEGYSDTIEISPEASDLVQKYCDISDDTIQDIAVLAYFLHDRQAKTHIVFIPCLVKDFIDGPNEELKHQYSSLQDAPLIVLYPFVLNNDPVSDDRQKSKNKFSVGLKYGVVTYQNIIKATQNAGLPSFYAMLGNGKRRAIRAEDSIKK